MSQHRLRDLNLEAQIVQNVSQRGPRRPFGRTLDSPWELEGLCWEIWGLLGRSLELLGSSVELLGALWELWGVILELSGTILEAFWDDY